MGARAAPAASTSRRRGSHAVRGPLSGDSCCACCASGQVDKIIFCDAIDKYVSISRDGSFRLWNGTDLKHFRTMTIGSSWITNCIYMPQARA